MGSFSIWHWLIVAVIILLLFGKGRISEVMGDMGKGIKSFKKGIAETEDDVRPVAKLDSPVAKPDLDKSPSNSETR